MDPEFVQYYQAELNHLRVMAKEFADEYPAIASRLGIPAAGECADPFVERLLEGYAYLAARVHLKLDAEFPQFSEELMRVIYPDYLAPLPATAIVEFEPDPKESSFASGVEVPRGSIVRLPAPPGRSAPCTFTTAHSLRMYPLRLDEVEYMPRAAALMARRAAPPVGAKSGLRLRLSATGGLAINELELQSLSLHLRGADGLGAKLFELIARAPLGLAVVDPATGFEVGRHLAADAVKPRGYDSDDRLMPDAPATFEGYRLLREYFLVSARFLFVDVTGLGELLPKASAASIDLFLFCGAGVAELENIIGVDNISLFATPAINLFDKLCDRVPVVAGQREFHVVVDRASPKDYEVFKVERVRGHLESDDREQEFTSLYAASTLPISDTSSTATRYYSLSREPRRSSGRGQAASAFGSYVGSEVFLTLGDQQAAPFDANIRQLSVHALCTNRDIPWYHAVTGKRGRAVLESAAPVASTHILEMHGPRPAPPRVQVTWRLLNHLSLNYLSLAGGGDPLAGALALRRVLMLYVDPDSEVHKRIAESIRGVSARPVVRRIRRVRSVGKSGNGGYPIVAARGLEVQLTVDESAFEGSGLFLFGCVMERFIAKFVSVNSFTETVILNSNRQEVLRWPPRTGVRSLL